MARSRLALVADDLRLAGAILVQLKKSLGEVPALECTYDAARQHLGGDGLGLLVLAAATDADADKALRLVQEIHLRKWPPALVVVEDEGLPPAAALTRLQPYVSRRLVWPRDAEGLVGMVKDGLPRGPRSAAGGAEPVEELIGRLLLGQTPSLLPLADRLALAAAHDVTVLITGETGTGKTYLARLMHDGSPRRQHPFLPVPCGAVPANLMESTFFGHAKGAFTGADRAKVGKFAAAGQGTILLDEIDALPLEQQAGLLRVIETGEFEPVGANETQRCAARIIVASNWDLEEAVEQGRFRQDLYYRLNVMSFHLPPLRERVQDVAPLVRGLAARFNTKFRKDLFDVGAEAMAALESFPWPGNIRQLENVVQQAVLVSSGPELLPAHLPPAVREYLPEPAAGAGPGLLRVTGAAAPTDSLMHNREQVERSVIQRALANNGYSRARAAGALGISRVTLYKKMKKYGMMGTPMRSSQTG